MGKTTVAGMVADRFGAETLRTDVVREELIAEPTYTDEERDAVYGALLDRARRRLEGGEDVVLDGTFEPVTAEHATVDDSGGLADLRRQVAALL